MNRTQLDHVLRAAGEHTGQREFVLVGSVAILAWDQIVPEAMLMSREADLFAFDVPEEEARQIADELDGSLGQQSQFDATFGYYVDGVEPATAILPHGWRTRSMSYATAGTGSVTAIVPHPDDIALSKLCAGREKDLDWVVAGRAAGIIDLDTVLMRVDDLTSLSVEERNRVRERVVTAKSRA